MDIFQLFWSASTRELAQGYVYLEEKGEYTCLVCGCRYVKGVVYPSGALLLEAERAMWQHIREEHQSMFTYLLNMNRSYTGLTDVQRELLLQLHQGKNDKEIAENMGGLSPSTVRSHRFKLREKEKQAKVFLALMSLLEAEENEADNFIETHRGAKMVDDRYAITLEEKEQVLNKHLNEDGTLKIWPSKEKRKLIILQHLIKRFDPQKRYTENEVNEIIGSFYHDYVTLRRYLIEYGFMDRVRDGSHYWVKV